MRTEDLAAMLRVLESGSIRGGAQASRMSQPSMSRIIRQLERELGADLLNRNRSGIELTEAGAAAMPWILDLLRAEQALREEVHAYADLSKGSISFGTAGPAASEILVPIATKLVENHPGLDVNIVEYGSPVIAQQVTSRELDFGLIFRSAILDTEPADQLRTLDLQQSTVVACIPVTRLDNERPESITMAELARHPFVLPGPGHFSFDFVMTCLDPADVRVDCRTASSVAARRMSAAGIGVTVAAAPSVDEHELRLAYIPITGIDARVWLSLIWHEAAERRAAGRRFLETFRDSTDLSKRPLG